MTQRGTIHNTPNLSKEQQLGNKPLTNDQHVALIRESYDLLYFFGFMNDKDCSIHHDDFAELVAEEIQYMMKNIKNTYYNLYPHREQQRC